MTDAAEFAVGAAALSHIAIASLSVGSMMLAPAAETLGRTRPHYTEIAHTLARFTLVTYTTSLVLAVIMIELFIGLFPFTNTWLFNHFRGAIAVGAIAFFLQLLALYPYYHFWDRLIRWSPRVHLAMGWLAAALVLVWVAVLDGIGSFMLTPSSIDAHQLWNGTWLPLVIHRFFGNLVAIGFVIAAYAGWRLARAPERDGPYYRVFLRTGLLVGIGALLIQPMTGLLYALNIQAHAGEAYRRIVGGEARPLLYVQFSLFGLLCLGSYLWVRWSAPVRGARWETAVLAAIAAAMVVSVGQPDLRRAFTFALTVLTGWLIARHRRGVMEPQPSALTFHVRALTTALAITALAMYLVMGTIRETARGPETVRGVISIDDDRAASAGQRAQLRAEP